MPIALSGTVPVSGLNIGLVAAIGGLTAEITQLTARIADLNVALLGQVQVAAAGPPNPVQLAAALTGALNVANATVALGAVTGTGSLISAELGIKQALVLAERAALSTLIGTLGGGLAAPAISGWCYSGNARGFGTQLASQTLSGFGRTAPTTDVQAIIIATESQSSWQAFAGGFRTGGTADSPADPAEASLRYQGELGGGSWNTGVASLLARIQLLKAELDGQASALQASINALLGIGLPDPTALVNAGLDIVADIGVTGLLDNLANVQTDISGAIDGLDAQIAVVTSLIADINAQLSASGLTLWTYTGPANELGAAFVPEIQDGVPGGTGPNAPTYGLVLAGSPGAMAAFGAIFTTA